MAKNKEKEVVAPAGNREQRRAKPTTPPKAAMTLQKKTDFTAEECLELQEMQRMVNGRLFEQKQIAGNTALVPRGQEIAKELEAIVRLLENAKNLWVSQKLREHGYQVDQKVTVNLSTGQIMPIVEDAKETK